MAVSRSISSMFVLFVAAELLHTLMVSADVNKNCTASPCTTCMPKNETCSQTCSADSCVMTCSAEQKCNMDCTNCNKMTCNTGNNCEMGGTTSDGSNAGEMECTAGQRCWLKCSRDNCKMTCAGAGSCYAFCTGKACTINCNSKRCQINDCSKGDCVINFGKGSEGTVNSCQAGGCTLNCPAGSDKTKCLIQPGACGSHKNCTTNYGSAPSHGSSNLAIFIGIIGGLWIALLFSV